MSGTQVPLRFLHSQGGERWRKSQVPILVTWQTGPHSPAHHPRLLPLPLLTAASCSLTVPGTFCCFFHGFCLLHFLFSETRLSSSHLSILPLLLSRSRPQSSPQLPQQSDLLTLSSPSVSRGFACRKTVFCRALGSSPQRTGSSLSLSVLAPGLQE